MALVACYTLRRSLSTPGVFYRALAAFLWILRLYAHAHAIDVYMRGLNGLEDLGHLYLVVCSWFRQYILPETYYKIMRLCRNNRSSMFRNIFFVGPPYAGIRRYIYLLHLA